MGENEDNEEKKKLLLMKIEKREECIFYDGWGEILTRTMSTEKKNESGSNRKKVVYSLFFLSMVAAVSAAIMLAPNALTLIGGVWVLVILSTEFRNW